MLCRRLRRNQPGKCLCLFASRAVRYATSTWLLEGVKAFSPRTIRHPSRGGPVRRELLRLSIVVTEAPEPLSFGRGKWLRYHHRSREEEQGEKK